MRLGPELWNEALNVKFDYKMIALSSLLIFAALKRYRGNKRQGERERN